MVLYKISDWKKDQRIQNNCKRDLVEQLSYCRVVKRFLYVFFRDIKRTSVGFETDMKIGQN
jgi:hypothetical protein